MLMLNHPRIWRFTIRIIHYCHTLVVFFLQHLSFKAKTAVLKLAETEIKIGVNRSRIYHPVSHRLISFPIPVKIRIKQNIGICKQFVYDCIIAINRDSLVTVIKVIIVIGKPDRKPLDNKGRQVFADLCPTAFPYSP